MRLEREGVLVKSTPWMRTGLAGVRAGSFGIGMKAG
jgi:hypothetical protein